MTDEVSDSTEFTTCKKKENCQVKFGYEIYVYQQNVVCIRVYAINTQAGLGLLELLPTFFSSSLPRNRNRVPGS